MNCFSPAPHGFQPSAFLCIIFPARMRSDPLIIEFLEGPREDQGVLRLHGALTLDNVGQFQSVMRAETAETMILDLSQVPFIDSAGLGSIVGAYVSLRKAGRWMALTGVNERVSKLFEVTRVQHLFLTFPSLREAFHALSPETDA